MSTKLKFSDDELIQFPVINGTTSCPTDGILCDCAGKDAITKHALKSKHYKSLFDFVNDVAEELPERQSFYTVDLEDVLWKVQEWKTHLPNVEIFYAVKANTDPILLQLLVKIGVSFDCATVAEMEMVFHAGASPENIIFANTIKTAEELKFASKRGVELMTFDNEDELLKIHRVYPNAKLLIRIVPTIVKCFYDFSEKFGCTEEDAIKLLKLAYQLKLNVIGISFHVGALCTDPTSYTSTIKISRRLFDAARDIGFTFSMLDIGGGFFGSSEKQNIFYTMADSINKALEEHFSNNQVRIIAEPGCYVVASACNLICTVLGRRCFNNAPECKPKRHYYLNDSVFCSFNIHFLPYGWDKPIPMLNEPEIQPRTQYESRLYGQTCSSVDVIMRSVVLPDLKVGERVIQRNMGAYYFGVSSNFCGIPLPASRHIFVNKKRLNTSSIASWKTIAYFLKKHVSFVACREDDI